MCRPFRTPYSLRRVLEVAFGGKFCLLISEKAEAVFPCASVSHWDHFATSPVPTRVRLVVFSCPCRDWIQSRGGGNLAVVLLELEEIPDHEFDVAGSYVVLLQFLDPCIDDVKERLEGCFTFEVDSFVAFF